MFPFDTVTAGEEFPLCDDPPGCGYSCRLCQERKSAMARWLAPLVCSYCSTTEAVCPLSRLCEACDLKRESLYTFIQGCRCRVCGCGELVPSSCRLFLRGTDVRLYFYVLLSAPDYPLSKLAVQCRCCSVPAQKDSDGSGTPFLRRVVNLERLKVGCCVLCKRGYKRKWRRRFEWDHVTPHWGTRPYISELEKGKSLAALHTELRNCRLLCLNCHDLVTDGQRRHLFTLYRFRDWEYAKLRLGYTPAQSLAVLSCQRSQREQGNPSE